MHWESGPLALPPGAVHSTAGIPVRGHWLVDEDRTIFTLHECENAGIPRYSAHWGTPITARGAWGLLEVSYDVLHNTDPHPMLFLNDGGSGECLEGLQYADRPSYAALLEKACVAETAFFWLDFADYTSVIAENGSAGVLGRVLRADLIELLFLRSTPYAHAPLRAGLERIMEPYSARRAEDA